MKFKRIKNFICLLLTAVMLISLTACSQSSGGTEKTETTGTETSESGASSTEAGDSDTEASTKDGSVTEDTGTGNTGATKIVCTIFPEYDWVKEIIKGHESDFELTLLMDKGTDFHSFQPTVADISLISECDIFIYVGGESDEWAEEALKNAGNPNLKALNLMEILGDAAKEEELKEGMESEEEEEDEDSSTGTDGEEVEYDEHVWLSLRNAKTFVEEISNTIAEKDEDIADDILMNAEAYREMLNKLDNQYMQAVDDASGDTLIFGDRFPFRYLVDDYGLNYYAAFIGCSAETEASFETVAFLAEKVKEIGVKNVIVLENSDTKIADTIIQTSGVSDCSTLVMNSLQSYQLTYTDADETYLGIMTDNLAVLRQALDY